MNLETVIDQLKLKPLTQIEGFLERTPQSGYASDLLSCVLAGAESDALWITLQGHVNVIAVAAMLDLCAVILTEDVQPDPETVVRAHEQGVVLLSTAMTSYEVAGRLWEMGLQNS